MEIQSNTKKQLLNWYWQFGSQRKGGYALSRGGWLDNMLRICTEAISVESARTTYSRPTIALWGPSQSGKSTMLAEFIDANVTEDGHGSALSWDDTPARFSGDFKNGTIAVLNPFSKGADASGCVTRFHMTKEVKYKSYPVEIQFAEDHAILLSLAVGYLSETVATTASGEETYLRPESLKEIADNVISKAGAASIGAPDKEAYLLLTEVLDAVDVLIDMELPRYANLRKEWPNRRSNLLNYDALISSTENVIKFACELLWDNWQNLNDVYLRLRNKRAQMGHKKIYCGIEIGALMLNIASAKLYSGSDYVRNLVNSCSLKTLENGDVAIVKGGGTSLFNDAIDFALCQGLVSLIKVPLRDDVMSKSHPAVYELLQKADLVDFPGVANEHRNADRFTNEKLSLNYRDSDKDQIYPMYALTKVMMRGKTASIVVASARNLNIDAFSLLVRMPGNGLYPSNPIQLMNGIRQWFKSMGKPHNPLCKDREMQINLVLTFSVSLLNVVHASGTGLAGLSDVFGMLKSMGDLADPAVVRTFCVNYPMFPAGRHDITDKDRMQEVLNQILDDKHFKRQFNGTETSLTEMSDIMEGSHGGRIYLFKEMTEMIQKSHRQKLLEAKQEQLQKDWIDGMSQALPSDKDEDNFGRDLELLINAINDNHQKAKDEIVAREILDFKDIAPESLEIVPNSGDTKLVTYLQNQLDIWQENARLKPLQTSLGFEDAKHRTRVLSYLTENVDIKPMYTSLRSVAMKGTTQERSELRRLVAIFFSKLMFPQSTVHRNETESVKLLERISSYNILEENVVQKDDNIHYISVIAPFLQILGKLKEEGTAGQRGVQPGDAEIIALNTEISGTGE